jgi:hypothetical protein
MLRTPFRRVIFHLPFLLVIGGMLVLIRHEKAKRLDEGTLKSLAVTMDASSEVIKRIGEQTMKSIFKGAEAYRTSFNQSGKSQAERLIKMVGIAQQQIAALRKDMDSTGASLGALRKVDKLPDWKTLADSLAGVAHEDSIVRNAIRTCLFDNNAPNPPLWWTTLIKNGSPALGRAFLKYQSLRLNLALNQALNFIEIYKIGGCMDVKYDYDKAIILEPRLDQPLNLGHPFEVGIVLSQYSSTANNLVAKINNKPVPIDRGKVHYTTVFGMPGKQSIAVDFQLKNPLTGEIKSYARSFTLNVLPECTPSN